MNIRDYHTGIGGCCKDCEERHVACHDHCEKYLDAKGKWEERKRIVKDAKDKEGIYSYYKRKKITKEIKKGDYKFGKYK